MKQSRLDELMKKAENENLTISELGEICGSILSSLSRHSNDIKSKLKDLEAKIDLYENKLNDIYKYQPVFNVITDMEDEPDQS